MDKKSQISYALVTLMDENKTQGKELAEYLDVTPSAITNYRNGTRSIDVDTLARICDFYEISIADILKIGNNDDSSEKVEYSYISLDEDGLDDDSIKYSDEMNLSDEEMELITIYRSLPPKGQHAVITGLRDYAEKE